MIHRVGRVALGIVIATCGCAVGGPPGNVGAVPLPTETEQKDMAVTVRALLGVEHRDGEALVPYVPQRPVPLPLRPGDAVWLQTDVPEDAWVYGIGATRDGTYGRLFVSKPGEGTLRRPLGAPLVVDEAFVIWNTLFVVAAEQELPWVEASAECSQLVGQPIPEAPSTPCEHLVGLNTRVPPAVRGLVAPPVANQNAGDHWVPSIEAEQRGDDLAAVLFHIKRRP